MKLIRRTETIVDGFEGGETLFYSYFTENDGVVFEDDECPTIEEIQEDDAPYWIYYAYQELGSITDQEIATLTKFGIIK